MAEPPPNAVGPYTPQKLLATGSQAQVWLAQGPEGPVALKIARTQKSREALAREVEVLLLGKHPGLVELLGRDQDNAWIAVSYVDGQALHTWAREASVDAILGVGIQLCRILQHLHDHRVIHADLKPTNVVVSESGQVTLLDLGLATLPTDKRKGFRGTLGYAAPELLKGAKPSTHTDIYGLGAVLYACLTGTPPFTAPDPAALTYLPLVSLPAPPASVNGEVSALLNQLVLTLLARDPSRRMRSLSKVAQTLERAKLGKLPRPILGMQNEREALRQAVVGACDNEARAVIAYGPPGCGRRTLIAEAVEAARREGLTYLKGADPRDALGELQGADPPAVLVVRESHPGAHQLAEAVLDQYVPCLLILHSDRPVPHLARKGAIQITPSPLGLEDSRRLVRELGGDTQQAEAWWRASLGLPIGLIGHINAWRRTQNQATEQDLPAVSQQILDLLRKRASTVTELAAELSLGRHALLDHCEVLFAEGLVVARDEGRVLAAAP